MCDEFENIHEIIGELFQEETKYFPESPHGHDHDHDHHHHHHHNVALEAGMPSVKESIKLNQAKPPLEADFWKILEKRRSRRNFKSQPITKEELEALLWATQGVTDKLGEFLLRTAPSAGALYPIDTYLSVQKVEGVKAGIYKLNVATWALELLHESDHGAEFAAAALDQEIAEKAAVVFIWSAVFPRSTRKYAQRAYRYVYLDAGHICQNLYLASEALGLGCCGIAALYDDEVNKLISADGRYESVIYMGAVGKV